ncbi:MAG: ATP-binding protein [Actinomycetota bacterium]
MQLVKVFSQLERNVLLRLLLGATTLLVSLGAYYSYQAARNVMLESLKQNALLEVQQGGNDLDRWLANLKVHIETLANTTVVKSMYWSRAEPYLKAEILRFNDTYALASAAPNGWCNITGSQPANISNFDFFQKAMTGKTNVSDPFISHTTKIPIIAVATPIRQAFDIRTTPSGEIHSLVRLDRIVQVVDHIKYGDNSYALALDSKGKAIADPNLAIDSTTEKLTSNLSQPVDKKLLAIVQRIRNRQQGIELISVDATQKYLAFFPLKEVNWSILLVIPVENIESQLRALDIIALVVAGLAVTMILVLWRVQRFEKQQLKKANELLEYRVQERTAALSATLEQLQKSQLQLIQSEKMSALGSLVAGVAHEINNPVNFIYGNITHANEYVDGLLKLIQLYQKHSSHPHPEVENYAQAIDVEFLAEDLLKILGSIRMGADRIRKIVLSLRNFSHLERSEFQQVDIHEGIDSTLLILQHRLKGSDHCSGVQVIKEYGALPLVECYVGQLNQVFMNILSNALDALEDREKQCNQLTLQQSPSQIIITTQLQSKDRIRISVTDNGLGIPKEIQQRIFDPFFTTKPVGKGTGMGMSISYQIITERHQGLIWCESMPTKGTKFCIEIPIKQATQ